MKRRSALLVTQYFPPESGAGARRARGFAQFLGRRGYTVRVLTAIPNYPARKVAPGYRRRVVMAESIEGSHVTRFRAPGISFAGLFLRSIYEMVLSMFLVPSALLRRTDLTLVTVPSPFLIVPGILARKLHRTTRLVIDVRDLTFLYAHSAGSAVGVAAQMMHSMFCWSLRSADVVTVAVDDIKQRLESAGVDAEKVKVLCNGVDTDALQVSLPEQNNGQRIRCLYAGLVGRRHGVEALAYAGTHLKDTRIILKIVGDGPEMPRLRRLVKTLGVESMFEFSESVALEDVPQVLGTAHIGLVTLRDGLDALPVKLLDAMAAGLPIVYVGAGEGAELVRRAECGLVVDWNDHKGIADAISHLASRRDERVVMGSRARGYVIAHFRRDALLEQVFGEIVSHE